MCNIVVNLYDPPPTGKEDHPKQSAADQIVTEETNLLLVIEMRFVSSCPRGIHCRLWQYKEYPSSPSKLAFPFQLHLGKTFFFAHNMVLTKASNKFAGCRTEPTNREAVAGKKMSKKRRPNYMKPTRSSDTRVEKPQVTTIYSPTSTDKHSKSLNPSASSSSSLLRPFKNKPATATCSSALKNSKFPKDLELHPGGTDAQGTSVMRVCPYNNCSLNGHWHKPLPSLKSFISGKRKLLNTRKSFKLKGLPLFKVKASVEDEEETVDDFLLEISAIVEEFQDLQLQSFGERNTKIEVNHADEYCTDMQSDDFYKNSELLIKEMDSILSFLEYVEFDETTEAGDEVKDGREPIGMPTLNVTSPDWGEDEESITGPKSNLSDHQDDILGPMSISLLEKETIGNEFSFELSSVRCEMAETDAEQLIQLVPLETLQNLKVESPEEIIVNDNDEEDAMISEQIIEPTINHDADDSTDDQSDKKNKERSCVTPSIKGHQDAGNADGSIQSYTKQDFFEIDGDPPIEDDNNYDTDDIYSLSSYRSSADEAINTAINNTKQHLAEVADVSRARMRITSKKTNEEAEQMKGFNPRSPRFLEIESEPEAEKVDLRHQTADEIKNREEWMIDYALRRVISRLDPSRKKKVSLLVKAFETVMPLKRP